ncbi:MAG: N-acetylglucosamine-6-phosphate deacetylase [Armatimonadota bacterium]
MIALLASRALTPLETIEDPVLLVEEGRIAALGAAAQVGVPAEAQVLRFDGCTLAPGFIDIHIHGCRGRSVSAASREALAEMSAYMATRGTTGFLAGIPASPEDVTLRALDACVEAAEHGPPGAQMVGVHLEGPFLNPDKKGAQPEDCLRPPDHDYADTLLERGRGTVRIMTVAPELPGAVELIRHLVDRQVAVSLGHTTATFDQAVRGIRAGATLVTHTYNTMPPFHHREPGMIGAALTSDEVYGELIADGVHVHPAAVAIVVRAKQPQRVVLVSDAMEAAGMADGEYDLAGQKVRVKEGVARLDDGTLASSTLSMDRAVANVMEFAGVGLEEAVLMASTNPALAIGLRAQRGTLAEGLDADIVVLNEELGVEMTMVGGAVAWQRS